MNKDQLTERDIRLPQFKDSKLEDLEFDGTGEVVRKDRFETSMRKIQGMLHGVNGLSSRSGWTCEQVVVAVNILLRFKKLAVAISTVPLDAEFYHFNNDVYVKDIDQEHLQIANDEPKEGHLINFLISEEDGVWKEESGFVEYINHLITIDDMRKEISEIRRGEHAQ